MSRQAGRVLRELLGGILEEAAIEEIAREIGGCCVDTKDDGCVLESTDLSAESMRRDVASHIFKAGFQPALGISLALLEQVSEAVSHDPKIHLTDEQLKEMVDGALGIEPSPSIRGVLEGALTECKKRCPNEVSGWDESIELLRPPFRAYLALTVILGFLDEEGDFDDGEFDELVPPPEEEASSEP